MAALKCCDGCGSSKDLVRYKDKDGRKYYLCKDCRIDIELLG